MQKFSLCHALLSPNTKREHRLHRFFFWKAITFALILTVCAFVLDRPTVVAIGATPTVTPTISSAQHSERGEPNIVNASQRNGVDAAPGYCPSSGGSTQYANITNAILTPNGDGTMKLQVNVFI